MKLKGILMRSDFTERSFGLATVEFDQTKDYDVSVEFDREHPIGTGRIMRDRANGNILVEMDVIPEAEDVVRFKKAAVGLTVHRSGRRVIVDIGITDDHIDKDQPTLEVIES